MLRTTHSSRALGTAPLRPHCLPCRARTRRPAWIHTPLSTHSTVLYRCSGLRLHLCVMPRRRPLRASRPSCSTANRRRASTEIASQSPASLPFNQTIGAHGRTCRIDARTRCSTIRHSRPRRAGYGVLQERGRLVEFGRVLKEQCYSEDSSGQCQCTEYGVLGSEELTFRIAEEGACVSRCGTAVPCRWGRASRQPFTHGMHRIMTAMLESKHRPALCRSCVGDAAV